LSIKKYVRNVKKVRETKEKSGLDLQKIIDFSKKTVQKPPV